MLDVDDLATGAHLLPALAGRDEVAQALRLVDLDRPFRPDAARAAVAALAERVAVVAGVARSRPAGSALEVARALDLTLVGDREPADRSCVPVGDLDGAVARLRAQVEAWPRAALVVAALLRATGALPVPDALAAEASAYSTLLAGPEFAGWLRARGPGRSPLPGDTAPVSLRRDGDLLRIRLDRPLRRNAMNAAMRSALVDALAVGLADPAVRVRLDGAGPAFCAGGDLDEFGTAPDPATAWVIRLAEHPGWALARLGDRGEAHVHGACAGAGVELPAFAGRVVAAAGTTFTLPELAMGLLPGAGGTVSLPRRIGRWRTAWLALTGAPLDARTALAWGLVDELAPADGG